MISMMSVSTAGGSQSVALKEEEKGGKNPTACFNIVYTGMYVPEKHAIGGATA